MAHRQVPLVLLVDADTDVGADRLAALIGARLAPGRVGSAERTLLDTFDGRLHRAGLTLWQERVGGGRRRLTLEMAAMTPLRATVDPPRQDRLLAADLPAGPLRESVATVMGERALLARVRLRSRLQPLSVLNGDGKTVVRLTVEEPSRGEGGAGRRLRVEPVLGYPRDFARACASLTGRGGMTPEPRPMVEDLMLAQGIPVEGVSSELDVALHPSMPAGEATNLVCRRLAEIVDVNLPGVLSDLDPEFLHDLRVAIRRSRSVLKEMRGVLAPDDTIRSRTDLKWIQTITGPTRDLDVMIHGWAQLSAPVPCSMTADLEPLVRLLAEERARAYASMRRDLRSRRYSGAWGAWRDLIRSGATGARHHGPEARTPIGDLAGTRIVSVYRTMVRMGRVIGDDSPPATLHELRKRGKELRYLLELFGGMWPREKVKPLVGSLKDLQDTLGHFQDDEIQIQRLRGIGPALAPVPGGTDSLIALGFVVEGLAASQRRGRQEFGARFACFADRSTSRLVTTTFAGRGR